MPKDPLSAIMHSPITAKIRRKDSLREAAKISKRMRGKEHTLLLQAAIRATATELGITGQRSVVVQRVATNLINALAKNDAKLAEKNRAVLKGVLLERFISEEEAESAIKTILTNSKRAIETH